MNLILCVTVVQCENGWDVSYTSTEICALRGSTVDITCTYTYPSTLNHLDTTVQEAFWFIKESNGIHVDLSTDPEYSGRVENLCGNNKCTLRISNLRESDSAVYKFRFTTNQPTGSLTGSAGVTLSVTGNIYIWTFIHLFPTSCLVHLSVSVHFYMHVCVCRQFGLKWIPYSHTQICMCRWAQQWGMTLITTGMQSSGVRAVVVFLIIWTTSGTRINRRRRKEHLIQIIFMLQTEFPVLLKDTRISALRHWVSLIYSISLTAPSAGVFEIMHCTITSCVFKYFFLHGHIELLGYYCQYWQSTVVLVLVFCLCK